MTEYYKQLRYIKDIKAFMERNRVDEITVEQMQSVWKNETKETIRKRLEELKSWGLEYDPIYKMTPEWMW